MKKSFKQINSRHKFRAVSVLTALLMTVPMVTPPMVSAAAALPNKVMTPVSSDLSWTGPIAAANDTFSFDASGHFPQLTSTPVAISASSSNTAVATASSTNGVVQVLVKQPGTFSLAVIATEQGGTALTDHMDVTITLLGDANGDGAVTSADVLYINKVITNKVQATDEEKNRLDMNRDGFVTSADATILMTSYVNKTPVTGGIGFIVSIKDSNDAPVADHVAINGTAHTGLTVMGSYRYLDVENDTEGASSYQWYRGPQEDGTGRKAIDGATGTTYTLQKEDQDQYLFFEVTPADDNGAVGTVASVHTVSTVPDTSPPLLDTTVPQLDAKNATLNTDIVATFNENVLAVAGKTVTIRYASDNSIAASYAANDTSKVTVSGKTVKITNPGLQDGTAYYVEIEAGAFKDLVGNLFAGLSGNTAWNFATPDTIAPIISTLSPNTGVTNANKSTDLIMTFSENVLAVAGKTVKIRKVSDDSVVEAYTVEDTSKIEVNGAVVTIHHPDFLEVVSYYVEVEAGAFTDAAGNGFAGLSGPTAWHFDTPDTTAPVVNTLSPDNGVTNASKSANLSVTFSENVVAAANKTVQIRRVSDDSIVASYAADDTSKIEINGAVVTIHNPGLDEVVSYYIKVDAGAFTDATGNPFAGFSSSAGWHFETPDTIAPTVSTLSPANGVTNANKSADLSVTFSENVLAIAGKTVQIRKVSDDSVVESYSANDTSKIVVNGAVVTIHNPGLDEVVSYYVEVEAGAFTDAAGNEFVGLSGPTAWHFDTPDTTAPTVSLTTPTANETGVSLTTPLSITFSEPVAAMAGHAIKLRKLSDNSVVANYSATDTSKVTVAGSTVTLENPGLIDETTYYVEIEAGAFADTSSNGFAGMTNSTTWRFTTPDTIAPTVSTFSPVNNASNASKSADLTLTFSEPVVAVAGKTIKIFNKADDSEKASYTADDATNVTVSDKTVTIHNPGLDEVSSYYVEIETGAFTDLSGNEYAGLSGNAAWTFTTPDSIEPTLISTTPVDDATGVTRTDDLSITFSEPVVAASGKYVTIRRAADNSIMKQYTANDSSRVSITGSTVTLLSPNLDDGGSFYVEVDAGAFTDPTGNAFAGISGTTAWNFTTPDTLAPVMSNTTPLDNATRVNRTANLSVKFNEPVFAVSGKTITIRNGADDTAFATYTLGTDPEVTVSGDTLTVQHADFAGLASYYVEIEAGAVEDATGNPFAGVSGATTWNFTAADSRVLDMTAAPLLESSLNGAVITLELTGDTFAGALGAGNFELNNAPAGLTIGSAAYVDSTHATVTLAFDSTDFDVDVANFSVTAKASALTGGGTLTTEGVTITALAEPFVVSTTPAANATGINTAANLTMTFDRNVTAAAGKTITIYRKSDNSVIQTINSNDTSKVTVSGSTVTLQHNVFNGGTNYYVLMQRGAFVDGSGLGSEPITSTTAWGFATLATPEMYFSEFLRGSGSHQVAIELYYPTSPLPNPAPSKAYSVFAYQYNTTTSSMEISEIKINAEAYKGVPLIIIDGAFYDFMDRTTAGQFSAGYQYYNQDDVIYDWAPRVLKALVLKKGSQVLDVIGDPNATGPGSFLASGGTLVRKSGVVGGAITYDPTQWNVFPVDTFNKIGNHTP